MPELTRSPGKTGQVEQPAQKNRKTNIYLSVLLACRNGADTLHVQLEALSTQQWDQPWEVVFIDNGSTDDSLAIAERYRSRIPEMQIISATERRGHHYALNVGARIARSDALAICDADDEVAPGWVAAMGEALARFDFVAGAWDTIKLNAPWTTAARGNSQKDGLMQQPGYFPYAGAGNMGVQRSALEAVGGFNENLPGAFDTDFCWQMGLAGFTLQFIPEAVLYVRFRASFRGTFRQAHNWGRWKTWFERRYCVSGYDKSFLERFRASTGKQFRNGLRIRSRAHLMRWVLGHGMVYRAVERCPHGSAKRSDTLPKVGLRKREFSRNESHIFLVEFKFLCI